MNTPKHVALIGCGFTGTSAFYQLVDRYPVCEITIFEASGEYGPGLPYRSDECDDYLLNNTNDTLCLEPNNRLAFLNWLNSGPDLPTGVEMPEISPRGNLPRTFFGYFLKDVFKSSRINAAIKDIKVNLISAEATEIIEKDDQVTIRWNNGEVTVDKVILTTGHCPHVDRYENPPDGSKALYFPDHVNEPSLDVIPIDATCYILGASLSAYDVVGRLFSEKTGSCFERDQSGVLEYIPGTNQRNVVLCSRSGRLKKMKSRKQKDINRKYFTLDYLTSMASDRTLKLEDIAKAIKKDCDNHDGDLNWDEIIAPYKDCLKADDVDERAAEILEKDVRTAIEGTARNILVDIFGDAGLEIWDIFAARLVSPEEENRYRSRFETATLTYEAACPILTAEKLLALHRAGKLKIIKGVERVRFDEDKDAYLIEHEFGYDHAAVLLNTTGSVERDILSIHQPALIQHMVKSGMMTPYVCGGTKMPGVDVDIETFRINGTKNIHLASQLLWGPGFYTSGAIYMATFVDRILKSLFNK